jgi:hypothetical protein
MILLTGFYRDPDSARCIELLECLRRNALNEVIDQIHMLVEEPADPSEPVGSLSPALRSKLRATRQKGRLTFHHLFAYANALLSGQHVIIANADIYFDTTLRRLQNLDLSGKLLCLSRWDVQADGNTRFFEHPASQDAWIFKAPIRAFPCDFRLGVPACENRLAWEADRSGLALSNPSRSVHANHLHLSGIRRYTERERLSGPTKEVPAELLGTPWLWFVLAVFGSTTDFSETISSLAGQPCANCIIVNGNAADRTKMLVPRPHEGVSILTPAAQPTTAGEAWNCGAMAVEDDGIICFVEGGTVAAVGLSEHVLCHFSPDRFLIRDDDGCGRAQALVCSKAAFSSVGGFDPTINDPNQALADMRAVFCRAGLREHRFCDVLFSCRPAGEGAVQQLAQGDTISREPLATIAFHEAMGCTVKRLTLGASSHNNDPRPFVSVPDALLGRAFTQAVSCSVSPIELQFLQPGKLYVLVGTDWEGYYQATEWLSRKATKEILPPATTASGTGFEIWSLLADAGARFVVPTQVLLVGDRLVRT